MDNLQRVLQLSALPPTVHADKLRQLEGTIVALPAYVPQHWTPCQFWAPILLGYNTAALHAEQATSAVTFPSMRFGNKAVQSVSVSGRLSKRPDSSFQTRTYTFCLEKVLTGPYEVRMLDVSRSPCCRQRTPFFFMQTPIFFMGRLRTVVSLKTAGMLDDHWAQMWRLRKCLRSS